MARNVIRRMVLWRLLYGRPRVGLGELISYWGRGRMMVTVRILTTRTLAGCLGGTRRRSKSRVCDSVFNPHITYF